MKEYESALEFWNDTFKDCEIEEGDVESLGCALAEEKLKHIASRGHVLDFGCGSGWASVYMAKCGAKLVEGVDQSQNAVDVCTKSAKALDLSDRTAFHCADDTWLNSVKDGSFDALFSCNVFDVVPEDVSERMLRELARVCAAGADVLVFLNPYADEALRERLSMAEICPGHYSKNGILRMLNRTDDEWREVFSKYFTFVSCENFRFEGEPDYYNRRMFMLKK